MPDPAGMIEVEVAYADLERQILRTVRISSLATVAEAIRISAILLELPPEFAPASLGIFGRIVDPSAPLRDGDRVELYRPLTLDPMEARRLRAKKKLRRP